jgi:hypothetical protein
MATGEASVHVHDADRHKRARAIEAEERSIMHLLQAISRKFTFEAYDIDNPTSEYKCGIWRKRRGVLLLLFTCRERAAFSATLEFPQSVSFCNGELTHYIKLLLIL